MVQDGTAQALAMMETKMVEMMSLIEDIHHLNDRVSTVEEWRRRSLLKKKRKMYWKKLVWPSSVKEDKVENEQTEREEPLEQDIRRQNANSELFSSITQ